MIYNFIALGVIVVFLFAISFILAKKYNKLKILDVDTIAEEKQSQVKERILIQRMRRRAQKSKEVVAKAVKPSGSIVKNFFKSIYKKIVALERKYQRESKRKPRVHDAAFEERVKSIIQEAEAFVKKEEWAEAEKKYIEVVSLDQENKSAYRGLVNLYLKQKEYQQAVQTIKYIIKLDYKKCKLHGKKDSKFVDAQGQPIKVCVNAEDLTESYLKLGEVYLEIDDKQQALQAFAHALQQSPNDPKTLDLLIQTCIDIKDRSNALDFFRKLQQVNPDNQKLIEYKKKLDQM